MEVRMIRENELDKLLSLYKYLHPNDKETPSEAISKAWQEIIENSNAFNYFVIEKDDIFVSTCTLTIIPNLTKGGRPYGLIENVVTHSSYRKKGFGRKVMEHALQFARSKNCYKIMLLSNVKRKDSHLFYESLGFNTTEKTGFYLKM